MPSGLGAREHVAFQWRDGRLLTECPHSSTVACLFKLLLGSAGSSTFLATNNAIDVLPRTRANAVARIHENGVPAPVPGYSK